MYYYHHDIGCSSSAGLYIRNTYRYEMMEMRTHAHKFTKLVPARSKFIPLTKSSPKHRVLDFS